MENEQKQTTEQRQLPSEVEQLAKAKYEVVRLRTIEKVSHMIGKLFLTLCIILIAFAVLAFGAVAAVIALSQCVPAWAACLIVGAVYLLLIPILAACIKPLFVNPVVKLLSGLKNLEELRYEIVRAESKAAIHQERLSGVIRLFQFVKKLFFVLVCCVLVQACHKPSKVEQYRAEKHVQDSIALVEQERSMAYYQEQLDVLTARADSLLPLFKYEKNEKYQDHGSYVLTGRNGLRMLVRDDAQQLLVYRNGKRVSEEEVSRLTGKDQELYDRAMLLHVVMKDIRELEQRIRKTSLEVQKYQKRLDTL